MRAIRPVLCFLAGSAAAVAAEPATPVSAAAPANAPTAAPAPAAGAKGGPAAGRGGAAGEERATVPAIFAPKAGGAARGAAGGRSGASKKLRELLERPASGRAISPEMAAKLGEVTKRAAPPVAAAPNGAAGTSAPGDAGDVLMLDPYVVEEGKLPQMKEREMLTPAGKLAEARRRQPGLRLGAIPLLNDGLALQMLEDDFARERREEEKDLRGLMKIEGRDVPADVKKQIDAGAAQRKGWIDERGTPFRPPK